MDDIDDTRTTPDADDAIDANHPIDAFDRVEFSDEELTELALDAEPFDPFAPDVEPFGDNDPNSFPLLPQWYMPAPGITRSKGRAAIMLGLALSFAVITVGGFCVSLGWPEFVWKN